MAKSSVFQTSSNSSVRIGTEVTPGTATVAGGVTLEMPVTEYSFSELDKHSLSVAPFRSGIGGMTQSDDMVTIKRPIYYLLQCQQQYRAMSSME